MKLRNLDFVPSRHSDGIVRQAGDEFLIYDRKTNKAHCLNQTAARVWMLCDGTRSFREIIESLNRELDTTIDETIVWMALKQLDRARLLDERIAFPPAQYSLSRREVLRRIGGASSVAILLPAVASILVPTPAEAASCIPCLNLCLLSGRPCCPPCTCQLKGLNLVCL